MTYKVRTARSLRKSAPGLEVEFDARPPAEVLEYLKFMKFRWSGRLGYWWRLAMGQTVDDIERDIEATLACLKTS